MTGSSAIADTEGWQGEFSSALLLSDRLPPEGLATWNGSDPAARYDVYRNNVIVNLVDGLCSTFPVCEELVGEEFFRAMAGVFVRNHPPRTRILYQYGLEFPDFVAQFEPARQVPYLAGVAQLEAARVIAWNAQDAEPCTQADWAQIDPARLPDVVVTVHPSAQILRSDFAVCSIWAAHQDECGKLQDIAIDEPECALVLRPQLDVEVLELPPAGAEFLLALIGGNSLGAAASVAQTHTADFDLPSNLAILMQSGFAVGLGFRPQQSEEGISS
jgi:hypothetical protein